MAHFSRPLKWIEELDHKSYDIYLASHVGFKKLCPDGVNFIEIECIDSVQFSKIVGAGAPIYDAATFEKHIAEDLHWMETIKPDLVIGDFRHSLSVSCRLMKIMYVNLANAYWSPDIALPYPLPEAPVIRKLGEKVSSMVLKMFLPIALKFNFFKMAFILRRSLRRAGLSFSDYRQVITDGDVTLYCDTPDLVPLKKKKASERFVGPVVWSVPTVLPEWWSELDPTKKRIFVSLGSSGPADSLPLIIAALAKLDVEVIVALAGKKIAIPYSANVFVTDFLSLEEACRDSDLVICNGGSPMCHAALKYGIPTIGIVCNNDQLLNMAHIQNRGAGIMLRYWNLTSVKITESVNQVLSDPAFAKSATAIKSEFDALLKIEQLQDVVRDLLNEAP